MRAGLAHSIGRTETDQGRHFRTDPVWQLASDTSRLLHLASGASKTELSNPTSCSFLTHMLRTDLRGNQDLSHRWKALMLVHIANQI